jgi:hypothetical protein
VVAGGLWPLRNAVEHGSPLWPFRSLPGGDPVPPVWAMIDVSLLSRPAATLDGRLGGYAELLAGALVLLAGGALAWLPGRGRAVAIASAVSAGALAAWAAAPSTGQPDTPVFDGNVLSTTRYAIPAIAAAGAALALAAAGGSRLAAAALWLALSWSLVADLRLDAPHLPPAWAAAAVAAAGAAVGAVATGRGPPGRWRAAVLAACLLAAALSAIPVGSLLRRQAEVVPALPGTEIARWARAQPAFADGQTIHFAGTVFGQLAGERLQHRLALVPAGEPCTAVRERAATGLVVVADAEVFARLGVATPAHCLAGLRPTFEAPAVRAYGELRPGPRSPAPGMRGRRLTPALIAAAALFAGGALVRAWFVASYRPAFLGYIDAVGYVRADGARSSAGCSPTSCTPRATRCSCAWCTRSTRT